MPLLVKPTLACNLSCKYCYENRLPRKKDYDLDWILRQIDALLSSNNPDVGPTVTLHGGEPLILPVDDIRAIFEKIKAYGKRISIQTNGTLINDEIIDLFKEYGVSVGVSIDGPGELNVLRTPPNLTEVVMENIRKLVDENISVGIITVVHKYNAGNDELFGKLVDFIDHLSGELGITGRLNPLGYPAPKELFLSPERLAYVYRKLAEHMFEKGYRWSPFVDMWNAITGKKDVVCVFKPCDPFNTAAALVIRGDRKIITNCQRHISLLRDHRRLFVREELLYHTPQEDGGCAGCRFFPICFGGCSANGINGDWRNRDINCPAWKAVFEYYDRVVRFMGLTPAYENAILPFEEKPSQSRSRRSCAHYDGIEHIDGNHRHIDSG